MDQTTEYISAVPGRGLGAGFYPDEPTRSPYDPLPMTAGPWTPYQNGA